tara:strand:+ start:8860 stop:9156 length:297 start_codon:yes stop_codon:yes gene_type:complete
MGSFENDLKEGYEGAFSDRREKKPVKGLSALNIQISGNHYKDMMIQPVEYIMANKIGFCEGCAIKYLSRWKSKGGIEDLRKAKHFIDLLIEDEMNAEN